MCGSNSQSDDVFLRQLTNATGDFNGDLRTDLARTFNRQLRIFINTGDGGFRTVIHETPLRSHSGPFGLIHGDFAGNCRVSTLHVFADAIYMYGNRGRPSDTADCWNQVGVLPTTCLKPTVYR